jgi:hypothetical protein
MAACHNIGENETLRNKPEDETYRVALAINVLFYPYIFVVVVYHAYSLVFGFGLEFPVLVLFMFPVLLILLVLVFSMLPVVFLMLLVLFPLFGPVLVVRVDAVPRLVFLGGRSVHNRDGEMMSAGSTLVSAGGCEWASNTFGPSPNCVQGNQIFPCSFLF